MEPVKKREGDNTEIVGRPRVKWGESFSKVEVLHFKDIK